MMVAAARRSFAWASPLNAAVLYNRPAGEAHGWAVARTYGTAHAVAAVVEHVPRMLSQLDAAGEASTIKDLSQSHLGAWSAARAWILPRFRARGSELSRCGTRCSRANARLIPEVNGSPTALA